jgi:hypothetical protein
MKRLIKQWASGIAMALAGVLGYAAFSLVFAGALTGIVLLGDLLWANISLFALFLLWIAAPVCACFLRRRGVAACFTLFGLRRLQGILMAVVISSSFVMITHRHEVKNYLGRRFFEGYRHWWVEPESDQDSGERWTVKHSSAEWALGLLPLGLLAAAIALPVLTWKASRSAVYGCMARMDKREILSRLVSLIANVLKWDCRPELRSKSWSRTILSHQHELMELEAIRRHRLFAMEEIEQAYKEAVEQAAAETGLSVTVFPVKPPWTTDEHWRRTAETMRQVTHGVPFDASLIAERLTNRPAPPPAPASTSPPPEAAAERKRQEEEKRRGRRSAEEKTSKKEEEDVKQNDPQTLASGQHPFDVRQTPYYQKKLKALKLLLRMREAAREKRARRQEGSPKPVGPQAPQSRPLHPARSHSAGEPIQGCLKERSDSPTGLHPQSPQFEQQMEERERPLAMKEIIRRQQREFLSRLKPLAERVTGRLEIAFCSL